MRYKASDLQNIFDVGTYLLWVIVGVKSPTTDSLVGPLVRSYDVYFVACLNYVIR